MGATDGDEEAPLGKGGQEEKILVSIRFRPLNGKEIARNDVSDWECINDNTIIYKNHNLLVPERSMYPTAYTFDRVFNPDSSTRQVYKEGAKEVGLSVVSGVNSNIFAYGQTSSGKTFTMTGITEYTIADIYDYIQKHTERDFLLKFSAMEIYNESVRDLLSADNTPLRLLDDPERGTIVEKLREETLRDWNHVIELLSICEDQRQIGETSLNETSSRSHQIIRLTVESSAREFLSKDNTSTLVAAVNFIDLAGSERASQSLSAGTRLKEGSHINRSLLTLGTVIRKLSKGRTGHVPFRDSKLTRILQSSLGGNARTAIICTMSPARSHVEQSRNTLLFASCAKEVTTNAQVNLVVSDKALVKQLQTQLARLESELRSSGSTFVTSNCAAFLQEKDLQIEKLEKEIKHLILQRDIAQSQVQDMLRLVGEDRNSSITAGACHYPNLRVRRSPESRNLQPDTFGTSQFSDGESVSCSDDTYVQIPEFEENFVHNNTSPRLLIRKSHFSESDSSHSSEEIEEQSNGASEDLCKDVGCIETEESNTRIQVISRYLSPEENTEIPAVITVGNEDTVDSLPLKEDGEPVSLSLKEDRELVSPLSKEDKESVSLSLKDNRVLSCIHPFAVPSYEKASLWHDLKEDLSSSGNLNLTKSFSCKARLMVKQSSPLFGMVENNERTPPNGSKKDFTGRPRGLQRKFSALKYGSDVEMLSRQGSQSSIGTAVDIVLEGQNRKKSTEDTCIPGLKEMAKLQHDEHWADKPVKEMKVATDKSTTSVKDVGLDLIEVGSKSPSYWPSKFKRLQREIIELWHACNVSLVHRAYFFLLFKGDPTDSIYMEVELRRLSFLKDTFFRDNHTLQDGHTLASASSIKALHRERQMLSKQMQKKLSEEEREILFLRWGIGLDTKNRRLQLVDRLWTNTQDMDHIKEGALLVAKLVGVEPAQAPKETFGLYFALCYPTGSGRLKDSLISLL